MNKLFPFFSELLIVCLTLFLLWSLASCGSSQYNSAITPTPPGSREVISSSLNLSEIWRYRAGSTATAVDQLNPPPALIVAQDKVLISAYVAVKDPALYDSVLTALTLDSGQVLWQTRYKPVGYGTNVYSSYFDNKLNRLYLQYSFRVSAFDAETGRQLWVTPNLGDHTGYLFAHEQQDSILTVMTDNNEVLTFDPNDGQLLYRESVTNYAAVTHGGMEMPVPVRTMGKWFDCYRPQLWPTLLNDQDMIIECEPPTYSLVRVNYRTGTIVWHTPRLFASSYAVRDNNLYILNQDAALVAIDIKTGQTLGSLQFDKKFDHSGNDYPLWVVIQDSYLVIYFGDTQELVAFKFVGK